MGLALSLPRKLGTFSTQEGHGQERKPRNEPGCEVSLPMCPQPLLSAVTYKSHQVDPVAFVCLPYSHFSSQEQVRGCVASAQQKAEPMGDPNVKTLILVIRPKPPQTS